ncbi:MAG: thioredoxin family protein [Ignavibacteriales bacterium]|nr:thioredoxin family protein [Ignavibacteriales bacterium]
MAIASIEIPLKTPMAAFALKDPYGKVYKGDSLAGANGILVVFTCNHCPYAKAVWPRLVRLAEYAMGNGVNVVGINPNIHPHYPEDAPEVMKEKIKEWKINFPYLIDDTQKIAAEFKAQCTPDIFLFNKDRELVYHGRIDDNWQEETRVTREELKDAITKLAKNQPIQGAQYPSLGCSIKWRVNPYN